jgi:glyoxylate reductase
LNARNEDRARPRVHVTGPVPAVVSEALAADFDLADAPEGVDGILSLITTRVDAAYLEAAGHRLAIVANYGVGVDNLDLYAARARGVQVANTPDVLTAATAELAIGLTLSLLRRLVEGDRLLRRGDGWTFSLDFMLGEGLGGRRFCVVGPGRIGRAAARLAEAFGAEPFFVGRDDDLHGALGEADVVSLHCPLTAETRHLIDARAFAAMEPTAVLVNTARGPIVDEDALVEALTSRRIAGAALDVFEREPDVHEALLRMENVVLTPHIGSATRSTREAMGLLAVAALRDVLLFGRRPSNLVG